MKGLRIRSLQERLFFFLLLPLTLFLFGLGLFGFVFARNTILNEWKEASVLKLERAAHHIDMRLGESLSWIERFNDTGQMGNSEMIQDWILGQMKQLDGISRVNLDWLDKDSVQLRMPVQRPMGMSSGRGQQFRRFHRDRISEITMQGRLNIFNSRSRPERLPELQMGVAVTAGEVVVGNIGSDTRAKYGIVGAPVNVTQRIPSFAGEREVILSERAHKCVGDKVRTTRIMHAHLKGIRGTVKLYVVERDKAHWRGPFSFTGT